MRDYDGDYIRERSLARRADGAPDSTPRQLWVYPAGTDARLRPATDDEIARWYKKEKLDGYIICNNIPSRTRGLVTTRCYLR